MVKKYGRYEIIKELGRGSMGIVYLGHDPQIDRLVAIKVLRQDRVTSEAFVTRFLKEARAIGRLSHPNIVAVYDVGEDQGTIYLTMEYIEGRSLAEIIKEKKVNVHELKEWTIQIADALNYAHNKGIVHRDIKPSNIIVQKDGHIKITDFGIAHIEDPNALQQTQAGEILGTPAYMSPEQVLGEKVDGRSDLFSLGIILYEALTQKKPFKGDTLTAIFKEIIQTTPISPDKISKDVSPELAQIIMKCLAKDPKERFQTGAELAEALKKLSKPMLTDSIKPVAKSKYKIFIGLFSILLILSIVGYFVLSSKKAPKKTINYEESITNPAILHLKSSPLGAEAFVDGKYKGKTPLYIKLPAGKHEIRLIAEGYYEWEAQVELAEGRTMPLDISLMPIENKK